ncbi:MAG: hypothetical protein QM811_22585 [Pirellulales bacterium]
MAAGEMIVVGKDRLHYLGDWEIAGINFFWFLNKRLIRVLHPDKRSSTLGNGFVITDLGREAIGLPNADSPAVEHLDKPE